MNYSVPATLVAALSFAAFSPAQTTRPATLYPANSPETIELLAQVQQRIKNTETVQANFVQEKTLAMLKHKLTLRGRFATLKPDRVIWVVESPVKYAIRVQGSEVRQWDEDTNKVQVMNFGNDPTFKAISQQIRGWFLGDYDTLRADYDVYIVSRTPLAVRFSAKGDSVMAKLMKDIEVSFNADMTNLTGMVIREASGDVTTLTLSNTRLNEAIPADAWEMPPK